VLIAQITDLHVAAPDAKICAFVDTTGNLARAVEFLNAHVPRPDVVLATGDLTDHGRPEQYTMLRETLDRLEMPVYIIPGNHDETGALTAAFAHHPYLPRDGGPLQYVIDDHEVRLVGVDTTRPGHHDGLQDEARLAWLEATLAAAPEHPTLVFMHHPPFDTGIWWMDVSGIRNHAEFEGVVRRHPQVRRVVAGHVHRAIQTSWGETVVSISPSTAHQVALDLVPEAPPVLTAEPPMLTLHDWRDGNWVSHTTTFDAPVPRLELAQEIGDWARAVSYLRERPPMPKTGEYA
jgi:3',5'-cyclic AMP phosphodiesterase CpdA